VVPGCGAGLWCPAVVPGREFPECRWSGVLAGLGVGHELRSPGGTRVGPRTQESCRGSGWATNGASQSGVTSEGNDTAWSQETSMAE
jgi:hypothetical protein